MRSLPIITALGITLLTTSLTGCSKHDCANMEFAKPELTAVAPITKGALSCTSRDARVPLKGALAAAHSPAKLEDVHKTYTERLTSLGFKVEPVKLRGNPTNQRAIYAEREFGNAVMVDFREGRGVVNCNIQVGHRSDFKK